VVTQSERVGASSFARERPRWRAVAIPSEHGGWGLTFEPVLLGLLVEPSWPGVTIGVAAMTAFLVRTPLKLSLGDRRRHRRLSRTRVADAIALGELALIAALVVLTVAGAGWSWTVPVLFALPLFGVELWYDIRSRGRRLVPELCGGVGIASVAAAIAVAGSRPDALAAALSLIVAARAMASIPFARTQVARLHHRPVRLIVSDVFQAVGVLVAIVGAILDWRVVLGTAAVALAAAAQLVWTRRPVPPAKQLGLAQLAVGLTVVAATAAGVLAWT
jgi:YwiC-like protein